ncbi:Sparc [Trichinella nativa]|uniref:Sparc n=1 Tax=Trichinella nativa TaxID=6335 RepID=A0A0V1KZU3_9BILA|nr:Sparc [Trichinella nativa]
MLSTKFVLLVLLCLYACDIASTKKNKHGKKNDWDQLEPMLQQLHKMDNDIEIEHEDAKNAPIDDSDNETNEEAETEQNPCLNHVCGWGKECHVNHKGRAVCQCAVECPTNPKPDPLDKVCSNNNVTYESICHLYRERCMCRREMAECSNAKNKHLHLQYLGHCKELEECTQNHLSQFSTRMADWLFQVMLDLKKRQELYGDQWVQMIEDAERDEHLKHVYPVIWKFCDLDSKPHDKAVTHHELIPLTAPVIPLESCIEPFLRQCDADADEKITLKEWGKCLGLEEDEIFERC